MLSRFDPKWLKRRTNDGRNMTRGGSDLIKIRWNFCEKLFENSKENKNKFSEKNRDLFIFSAQSAEKSVEALEKCNLIYNIYNIISQASLHKERCHVVGGFIDACLEVQKNQLRELANLSFEIESPKV